MDPAAGGVVDGVQLLEQDAGVGQGEVAIEEVVENIAVGDIEDLRVLVEIGGELRQGGRHRWEKLGAPWLSAPCPPHGHGQDPALLPGMGVGTGGTQSRPAQGRSQVLSQVLARAEWAPKTT